MKKLAVFFVLALLSVQMYSQNVIKGKLADASSKEPEVGAIVQVFDGPASEGRAVGYAMSDSLGAFSIKVAPGRIASEGIVQIMNLGRKTLEFSIKPAPEVDLGEIFMTDEVETLAGSTVTALKTLVKIDADRLTYDIEADTDSKTMTVLEMLRKVPMVTVDAQDNITVNGSSSFKVYVDGRPNQMLSANPSQMFKLMPASNIKSIEVVTNPGAKYDAEGTGGVLEIKTKTGAGNKVVADGIYGTVTGEINTRLGLDGGLSLNAQKGKWTFGADISVGTDPFYGVIQNDSKTNKATGERTVTSYTGNADQRYLWGSLNASYEIDTLNLVTAYLGGNRFYNNSYVVDGTLTTYDALGNMTQIEQGGKHEGSWNGLNGSLDYQHRFAGKQNKYITLSYQFSGSPQNSNAEMTYGADTLRTLTDDNSIEHTFQADYTAPLWSDNHTLSTGLKYILRKNVANDIRNAGLTGEEASIYDYRNDIGALYSEYSGTFGKFIGKAGLRYEHTWVDVDYETMPAQSFRTNYPVFVPNLSIQYNLGMTSNISFSYNMRISRPGINYLNPYKEQINKTSVHYGNPEIEAEKSHRFQLAYNMASPKWVLSLRLIENFGDGGIGQYSFYDAAGILNTTYDNIQRSSRTSLNAYVNWNATNKTRVYLFSDGGYEYYLNTDDGLSNGGWSARGGLGAQHTLPHDFRLSGNLFMNSGGYSLQGSRSGMGFASLGVTKSFLQDRLSLSLRGQSNLGCGMLEFSSHSESNGFISDESQRIPIRSASFSISYTFGKGQRSQVKHTARSITNDDLVGNGGGSSIGSQVSSGM
ncbi:MAG: TonB-dependent receptor [Bacteroidales bacterium]|nr:TonB-dependent receptor [Bacteroidales bacterium]